MSFPKCYIGPTTKNVVDAVIEINEDSKQSLIGLIPSRRQIEFDGGYVNNWTTKEFSLYVKNKSNFTILKRDHGGEGQGKVLDDGLESYKNDIINGFDMIHIDPWKKSKNVDDAIQKTLSNINFCISLKKDILFEIGTEQAIYEYPPEELGYFLAVVRKNLGNKFDNVKYGVVQGGTKISDTINLGKYDREKLKKMCDIVKSFDLLSKEHNGDYLTRESIQDRFSNGLDAINIAPEFGVLETKMILENLNNNEFEEFYKVCFESKKWEKWVSKDFDFSNKKLLIEICGHYNIKSSVIDSFKENNPQFDEACKNNIKNLIREKVL